MTGAIYFISDTHLGDGSHADRFLYPQPLLALLARIESEPGAELVLLGDVIEIWSCTLEGAMVQHAPIFHAIARIAATRPVTYVVGNHDCLPFYHYLGAQLGNLVVAERYLAGGGALVALHGHQFDPFNRVRPETGELEMPWAKRLFQLVGLLQRLGNDSTRRRVDDATNWLADLIDKLDHLLPHWDTKSRDQLAAGLRQVLEICKRESPGMRGYPEGETRYEQAAAQLMRQGARFVLMGHTHHPLVRTWGRRVYVNTGSWVWDRYPPTYGLWQGGRLLLCNALDHTSWDGV